MKNNEATYELLAKQYEVAKIDEAKDSAIIQVMDKAISPDIKSKPKRSVIVLLSVVLAFVLAAFYALLLEAYSKAKVDRGYAERLTRLKGYLFTGVGKRNLGS